MQSRSENQDELIACHGSVYLPNSSDNSDQLFHFRWVAGQEANQTCFTLWLQPPKVEGHVECMFKNSLQL